MSHLSQLQPRLAEEHSRNLLARWVERGEMIAAQHRALGRRILEDSDVTVPRRTTDPYDPHEEARRLRGLPAIGVRNGIGGAIRGTRPGDGINLDDLRSRRG